MNKQNIISLIAEAKKILPHATPDQKMSLIKMLESAKQAMLETEIEKTTSKEVVQEDSQDYLQEK